MSRCQGNPAPPDCVGCDIGPFKRNHYFTGKLLVERDFKDEQRYYMDKLRHHHQQLHGKGVVCGLNIVPHAQEECQADYFCLEPGTAVDCCGREIVVFEAACVAIEEFESIRTLLSEAESGGVDPQTLQICLRYRECPTEEIPVLYDECGCDDTQCAPNRILESWALEVTVLSETAETETESPDADCCNELLTSSTCPACDSSDCIVLATIENYLPGNRFALQESDEEAEEGVSFIDNLTHRQILPSTQALADAVRCLCLREPTGGGGDPGISDVTVEFLDCTAEGPAEAYYAFDGGVLELGIPKGCDGTDGENGERGEPGFGLEENLVRINALSWEHGQFTSSLAEIVRDSGSNEPGIIIEFTDVVDADAIDADHIFQVLVPIMVEDPLTHTRLIHRCMIPGRVIPVKDVQKNGTVITKATETSGDASAVAFLFPEKYFDRPGASEGREFWVMLRGQFVRDMYDNAIAAEFVRGELPTGNRPTGENYALQGGVFESWFFLKD